VMLAFEESLNLGFDGAFVHQSPLSWLARNNSKSGRDCDRETWVLHTAPAWTAEHIDDSPEEIKQLLVGEFWKAVGRTLTVPIHEAAHRWRFAIPKEPLTANCLFDQERKIGGCGDWCGGPRVEGAFLSGMAIAGRVLGLVDSLPTGRLQEREQLELF